MTHRLNLVGQRFGKLVVIQLDHVEDRETGTCIYWKCKCDCGGTRVTSTGHLRHGSTKSCGCLIGEHSKKYKNVAEAALYAKYQIYQHGATSRSLNFDLTYKQFVELICSPCYYCGKLPFNEVRTRRNTTECAVVNGIDRKDNSIGYTLNNCVPCCTFCNIAKGTLSEDEFKNNIRRIYKHLYSDIEG